MFVLVESKNSRVALNESLRTGTSDIDDYDVKDSLVNDTFYKNVNWKYAENEEQEEALVGYGTIRRPMVGIETKVDSYSTLEVRKLNQQVIPLKERFAHPALRDKKKKSGVSDFAIKVSNFIIENISSPKNEKTQIVETFGGSYVYFYGKKPEFVTFSGKLINSNDFNWVDEFWYNYDNFLRGTKLLENNAVANLYSNGKIYSGYLLGAQASENAQVPNVVQFSINMLVTDVNSAIPRIPRNNESHQLDRPIKYEANVLRARKALLKKKKSGSSLWDSILEGIGEVKGAVEGVMNALSGSLDTLFRIGSNRLILMPSGWWQAAAAAGFNEPTYAAGSLSSGTVKKGGTVITEKNIDKNSSEYKFAVTLGGKKITQKYRYLSRPETVNAVLDKKEMQDFNPYEYIGSGSLTADIVASKMLGSALSPIQGGKDLRDVDKKSLKKLTKSLAEDYAKDWKNPSTWMLPKSHQEWENEMDGFAGDLAKVAARVGYGAVTYGASILLQTGSAAFTGKGTYAGTGILAKSMLKPVDLSRTKKKKEVNAPGIDGEWGKFQYLATVTESGGTKYTKLRRKVREGDKTTGFMNPSSWSGGYIPEAFRGKSTSEPQFIDDEYGYYLNGKFVKAQEIGQYHVDFVDAGDDGWDRRVTLMREYRSRVRGEGYEGLGARGDWGKPDRNSRRVVTVSDNNGEPNFDYRETVLGGSPSGSPFSSTPSGSDDKYVPAHQRGEIYTGRKPEDNPAQFSVSDDENYIEPGKRLFQNVVTVEDAEGGTKFKYTDVPGGNYGDRSFSDGYIPQAYRAESFSGFGSFGRWGSRRYTRGYIPQALRGTLISNDSSNEGF